MRALFKRDFYLLKLQLWFFLAVFAGLTVILLFINKTYLLPGKLTGAALCFYLSILQDEKNNFSQFEKSLPLGSVELTWFRYFSGFGVCFTALLVGTAAVFLLQLLFQVPVDTRLLIESIAETFICIFVLLLLLIPLLVRMGAQKLPTILLFGLAVWVLVQFTIGSAFAQLQHPTGQKCLWLFLVMALAVGFCKSFETTHKGVLNQ